MKIVRAEHLGMCFGVRDAITLATEHARGGPLTVAGDLVHNPVVLAELQARGVRIEREVGRLQTPKVMITAHGASERRVREIAARGHEVIEATCPLVRSAHQAVTQLVRDGFHPVVVGQRNHVEIVGMTEDLHEFDVVLSEAEIADLAPRAKFGVVAQTTQPIERVRHFVAVLRERFPTAEVRFVDTVCRPTKQRQNAATDLARQCDAVVVIGGRQSNNTRELVETCRRQCSRVFHVESAADLDPSWFQEGDTVGITAGTSTPDSVIDGVEATLARRSKATATRELQAAAAS